MDLKKFILPTKLDNTDEKQDSGNKKFQTEDLIYLDSSEEVGDNLETVGEIHPTDYAVMNNACMSGIKHGDEGRKACSSWFRDAYSFSDVEIIDFDGIMESVSSALKNVGMGPALRLNLQSVISARSAQAGVFPIKEYKVGKTVKAHTIEFGEYPKTYVGERKNKELERLFSSFSLKPTGKKYTGRFDDDGNVNFHHEYEYQGAKYVRVLTQKYDGDSEYSDGTEAPESGTYLWVKVEPIVWQIRNWDELPKSLNPKGTGAATYIDVRTQEAITAGIPFYPNASDNNCTMWQNSTIRGYLNGINVNNIKTNGNTSYTAPNGGDFTKQNFLTEALNIDLQSVRTLAEEQQTEAEKVRKPRKGYGVQIQETPMSVKEQIHFYISSGKSFMLHGPSGIGKTRRVEEADPNLVSIVLRNGILPEEVIGKTIYPNNNTTTGGIWVPPAWYVNLCEKCEKEPDKNHVLFIDEITNVKPSEQSLVFHLVLKHSIGPNIGKLPNNVVVVAAGNSKEESEAAYNMPEPLFRRFEGHIDLGLDIKSWLEWGSELTKDGRPKIHPLIANFVSTYANDVFYSAYNTEEPPKYAIDPRGWEQVSDIIYANKGTLAKELLQNKIGPEITQNLIAFAKNPPLMLEDVLENNFTLEDIPDSFDAQYALALNLKSANEEQIEEVRNFISRNLGSEILSMFDSIWVGEDNERALLVEELKKGDNAITQSAQKQPSRNYKITLDEFFASKDRLAINCDKEWKAKALCKAFHIKGEKWINGESYLDETSYELYGVATVYCNERSFSKVEDSGCVSSWPNAIVFKFEDVDISKYQTFSEQLEVMRNMQRDENQQVK